MAYKFYMSQIDLPIATVRNCPGFALDIGGSAVKFAYRSKTDWEAVKDNKDATTCPVRLLTCGRNDLDFALAKVKDEAYISREEGKVTKAFSCGVGGYELNDKIKEFLDVEVINTQEGDCLVKGLQYYMKHVPQHELIHPTMADKAREFIDKEKVMLELWKSMDSKSDLEFCPANPDIQYPEDEALSAEKSMHEVLGDELYPFSLLQLGSAYGGLMFDQSNVMKMTGFSENGGRYFMGIASLLTGVKSYDEFIDLAEKGDFTKVTQTYASFNKSAQVDAKDETKDAAKEEMKEGPKDEAKKGPQDGGEDPYAEFAETNLDHVVFAFGHTVFKDRDDFKREDLAQAWLFAHIYDLVTMIHTAAVQFNVQNFFAGGSFANRPFVREHMLRLLMHRDCQQVMSFGKQYLPRLYFLKNGGHTGSTGALIYSADKLNISTEA